MDTGYSATVNIAIGNQKPIKVLGQKKYMASLYLELSVKQLQL